MIKVWDYLNEMNEEKDEIFSAIEDVLNSGWLILGEQVKAFEEEFASYCDCKYGVGVANATDGLFLALRALGISEGDEVITVSNTAVPTVSAIVAAGARPVFVDVDPVTALMDVKLIEDLISTKTRCILPVHLFGQCVDMHPLLEIAKKHKLKILEDCSQSHGASYKGIKCGSFGDASVFSFYPTKPLGTYGDGGIVLCQDESINEKLRSLRFYGMKQTYFALEDGYNSRLDELHAAILRKKLLHLDKYIERRRQIASIYNERLADTSLVLPHEKEYNSHVYYVYVVSHENRDSIMEKLKARNIFLNISYPWPIHTMPPYKKYLRPGQSLNHTEFLSKRIFSLPMYPGLENEKLDYIIGELTELL